MNGLTQEDINTIVDGLKRYEWLLKYGWKDEEGFKACNCPVDFHNWVTVGMAIQKAKNA